MSRKTRDDEVKSVVDVIRHHHIVKISLCNFYKTFLVICVIKGHVLSTLILSSDDIPDEFDV